MSLKPVDQPIRSPRGRGTSSGGPIIRALERPGTLNDVLGRILQSRGIGAIRRPKSDGRKAPRQSVETFQKSERAILTRKTAASRVKNRVVTKPATRSGPPVFSTAPGIPIERISEIPRPGPVASNGGNRFSIPSIDFLGAGQNVVHLPAVIPKPEAPVSIHKSILSGISGGLSAGIQKRITSKIAPAAIAAPAIAAAAGRVLPAIGRVLGSRTVAAGSAGLALGSLFGGGGSGGVCASGEHLNKQDGIGGPKGTYCVKNRRMNFGNARAARRSVRRLKGARKLLRDIEKMMPTRSVKRRAPQHHHHPAAGG